MKKLLYSLIGLAFLCVSCTENEIPQIEQNPYRTIEAYTPHSCTMEVPGTLTPVEDYDWITVSTSGNTATFDMRRNTTGLIRRAEFVISGSSFIAVVNQEEHTLDATNAAEFVKQVGDEATISTTIGSSFEDDYSGDWGYVYSTSPDLSTGTHVAIDSKVKWGYNELTIPDLEEGTDYYAWSYIESTEGDKIYSNMVAILPPVYVRAGDDLQTALNNAKPYSTVMVEGGLTFEGPISFVNNPNKTISGGWDSEFTVQSMDNLTKINGNGKRGIICCGDETGGALSGSASVSYFEVYGCEGNDGIGIIASGGPINIHHCWFHDNTCGSGGVIATGTNSVATELNIWNCKFNTNTATGGHCCGVRFGEGPSKTNPVKGAVVNCLFYDNWCRAFGGYASVIFNQANSIVAFVNNTIVENFNYMDGGTLYQGIVLRDDSANLFANNIIVGNTLAVDKENPPVPFRHPNVIGAGSSGTTIVYNVYEGTWRDGSNVVAEGNEMCTAGFDYHTVCDTDYKPCGSAIGKGSLGTFNVKFRNSDTKFEYKLKGILEKYNTDLAGNPRVVNGKVDCGCYQSQN